MREINLLPPNRRRSLQREATMLALSNFFTTAVLAASILTVGALVCWGLLKVVAIGATQTSDSQLEATLSTYQGLRDGISTQNFFLRQVYVLGSQRIIWSQFLEDILKIMPPGTTIMTMNVGSKLDLKNVVTDVTLNFNGQAPARGTLILLRDRLAKLPLVASVDAPTSNLIQRDNPLYKFNLTLKPNVIPPDAANLHP